jgi:hypothetical protein
VRIFKKTKFSYQQVVVCIRNDGGVTLVIGLIVLVDEFTQPIDSPSGI